MEIVVFAFFDNGSELTLIRADLAKLLGLTGPRERLMIDTVNGTGEALNSEVVSFEICALDGSGCLEIEGARTKDGLNIQKRSVNVERLAKQWPHLAGLPLVSTNTEQVAILIGGDQPAAHDVLETRMDPLRLRAPRALRTRFGWCLFGPVGSTSNQREENSCNAIAEHDNQLRALVDNFFRDESFGTKPNVPLPLGKDERRAREILQTAHHNGTRYACRLLWAREDFHLPDNKNPVLRRFNALERRFEADPELGQKYATIIRDYIKRGYAHKLNPSQLSSLPPGRTWFNPHHPVFHPHKPGKPRVVFDLSARFEGVSLNSLLLKGPDLLANLNGILHRFRQYEVPLVADIEKMFHQVELEESDKPVFCFFWREPGSTEPPAVHQMDVHLFGAASSPAICAYVLQQTARDAESDQDTCLHQIVRHFYVGNWLVSFQTEAEAVHHAHLMFKTLKRGGFNLTQWASSSSFVRASLPGQQGESSLLNMDLEPNPVERTLGLVWDYKKDVFRLQISINVNSSTKREMLRALASIFDPLGFLAAVVFKGKCIYQDLWRHPYDWDDKIDKSVQEEWTKWATSLSSLESLTIPRCITTSSSTVKEVQLHICSDASEAGFGAVAYARFLHDDGQVRLSFLSAKSRVSSLKYLCMPRRELNGAVLALRLGLAIEKEMDIKFSRTVYWTDSTNVLRWINSSHCRFHIYVGHRIGEIHESSSPEQWHYIRTAVNPADDVSRGIDATEFNLKHRFIHGPAPAFDPPESWTPLPVIEQPENDPEIRSSDWV